MQNNATALSQLSPENIARFYRLLFGLLQSTNERHALVPSMLGKDFHQGIDHEAAYQISAYIWNHTESFDAYLQSTKRNEGDSAIIRAWQQYHSRGKFYIVNYLKQGAVLLSTGNTAKVYLVKALVAPWEDVIPKQTLPFLIETVLLPFENDIVTCGLWRIHNIVFGRNMSTDIRLSCQQAELTYGLITSLPHTQIATKSDKDIAMIKFYLHSSKNADLYQEELEELINTNPPLYFPVYFYHRGLLQAKIHKKECRALGLKKFHVAFYGAIVIAAHPSRKEVEDTVHKLIPSHAQDRVVYDKV